MNKLEKVMQGGSTFTSGVMIAHISAKNMKNTRSKRKRTVNRNERQEMADGIY